LICPGRIPESPIPFAISPRRNSANSSSLISRNRCGQLSSVQAMQTTVYCTSVRSKIRPERHGVLPCPHPRGHLPRSPTRPPFEVRFVRPVADSSSSMQVLAGPAIPYDDRHPLNAPWETGFLQERLLEPRPLALRQVDRMCSCMDLNPRPAGSIGRAIKSIRPCLQPPTRPGDAYRIAAHCR
jgi:hypothetical protein